MPELTTTEANRAVVRRLVIAEDDKVVGRFRCSATHTGDWLGHPATGRRFDNVDEVNIYRLRSGRIVDTWSFEDNLARLTQLGLIKP